MWPLFERKVDEKAIVTLDLKYKELNDTIKSKKRYKVKLM